MPVKFCPKCEEGNICPECKVGKLIYPPTENCSCHISPPCAACVDKVIECSECGWSPLLDKTYDDAS